MYAGNKYTNMMTSNGKYELRVDIVDKSNKKTYAVYKTFFVGDAASKYKLTVGDYSGNAGEFFYIMSFSECLRRSCLLLITFRIFYMLFSVT